MQRSKLLKTLPMELEKSLKRKRRRVRAKTTLTMRTRQRVIVCRFICMAALFGRLLNGIPASCTSAQQWNYDRFADTTFLSQMQICLITQQELFRLSISRIYNVQSQRTSRMDVF